MSSSGSGKFAGKHGGNWRNQVQFDPHADERFGNIYKIEDDSLIDSMTHLIDDSETIEQIWVFQCPLWRWQLTQFFFNHQFVVVETKNWWWSIEKNSKHILIQRAKRLSSVKDSLNQTRRYTPVMQMSYDRGRDSMKELITFLYKTDELNKHYDWINDNCKSFTKRVFDQFAKKNFHHP